MFLLHFNYVLVNYKNYGPKMPKGTGSSLTETLKK